MAICNRRRYNRGFLDLTLGYIQRRRVVVQANPACITPGIADTVTLRLVQRNQPSSGLPLGGRTCLRQTTRPTTSK